MQRFGAKTMSRHAVSVEIDGQIGVLHDTTLHVERRERRAELQRDLKLLSIFIAAGVGLEGLELVLELLDGVGHGFAARVDGVRVR